MIEVDASSPRPLGWWETRHFAYAMMALAALPLIWWPIPPLTDLLGHMGRYRVELDVGTQSPLLHYYAFKWGILGNLGVDLLVVPLSKLFGLEFSVKLIALAIPPLTVAGLLLVAREAYGRVPATTLFALPLAYSYPFQFGFINFALAMALMLLAFAFWLRLARTGRLKLRRWLYLFVGFAVWLAHSFAWGVLGVLCWTAEFVREKKRGRGWFESWWRATVAVLPLVPPALLLLPWRGGEAPKGTFDWFDWTWKWRYFYSMLRDRWPAWDIGGAVLLTLVALSGLINPWRRIDPTLGLATLLLALTFVLLPRVLLSSAYADMRLVPFMIAIAILALKPRLDRRLSPAVATIAVAFFAARMTAQTVSYALYERNYQTQLAALQHIQPGSRVMVLATTPCRFVWHTQRTEHLSSMAIVRRESFVNDQWMIPGQQLLSLRYRDAGRFSHDPTQLLRRPDCRARNEPLLADTLAHFPRQAFDYLWLIDMPRAQLPIDAGLVELWQGPQTGALYRIVGSATASSDTPKGKEPRTAT
ncbi:MAG: hypothetical protein JOY99_15430 [Sphingomonadaceae bacterium]|nr:hypothetical protein [Sphingomonadaceae bacterium]